MKRPKTATSASPTRLSTAPIRSPSPLATDVSGKVTSGCWCRISVTANGEEEKYSVIYIYTSTVARTVHGVRVSRLVCSPGTGHGVLGARSTL